MTRTLSYVALLCFASVSVVVVATRPEWVSDENVFLRGFVNHEFLNLLGVILAITLASVASIHLEFNKIEERYKRVGLSRSRSNLRKNALWLIGLFVAGVVLVAVKPLVGYGATGQGFINMAAMLVVLWHVLILLSLTNLVFAISPDLPPDKSEDRIGQ